MFKKLRNHMLIFNMVTVSLVIVTAFSVIYLATYKMMERENERQLQAMSAIPVVPNLPPANDIEKRPDISERFGPDYRVSFVLFVKRGELETVHSRLDFEDYIYEEALLKTKGKSSGKITLDGRKWAFAISDLPMSRTNQSERIAFLDITSGTHTLNMLLITLLSVGFAVLLVLAWFSYHFVVRAVSPIEASYNKQKQFVADASHELKTPLAIISANIDAIETSANDTVASQKEWFGYIRAELHRTGKLVDDLLYLAKAEFASIEEQIPFNLSHVCELVCASMEAVLYEREICLEMQLQEEVIVTGDREKITQVIYILMENAGKYTTEHGHITISLAVEHDRPVIRVSNTGQGIDPQDLSKIFDRFYRTDRSRSQQTGGFGLGLSIAQTIVHRSGGEISVESNDKSTTFTIRLKHV